MGFFSKSKDKDTVGAPGETPFVAPPAWDAPLDTAALTAPVPEKTDAEKPSVGPLDPANSAELQQPIIDAIKTVFDPEIPVDIYELGLIYEIIVDAEKRVLINMTLTSPACPSAQQIPSEVKWKVKAVPGVTDVWVEIVWEPAWDKDRMSEAAKLQLGFL
jgi:FeS assembly SUF system protein